MPKETFHLFRFFENPFQCVQKSYYERNAQWLETENLIRVSNNVSATRNPLKNIRVRY